MIGGVFFLASIIAIFIVLKWFTKNDTIPEDQPTTGLLAMRPPGEGAEVKTRRRWTREGALKR